MKSMSIIRLLTALALVLLLPFSALAQEGADGMAAELESLIAFNLRKTGAEDLQAWADGPLAETADGTGGWYLIALRRYLADGAKQRDPDFSVARAALERKAGETAGGSMTKRLRMSLALLSLESESTFPGETAEALGPEEPLMTAVFGLHLMNNLDLPEKREQQIARLLSLQLEDGGWAVIGSKCDPDCTAMAMQALAPFYGKREDVTSALDAGLAALSGIQRENGAFLGLGLESPESCAQVLLALSSLGIDAEKDERFLKNGCSVPDAMRRFLLPDGGYAHSAGDTAANDTATVQVFYALCGYRHMLLGGGPYWILDFGPAAEKEDRIGTRTRETEKTGGAEKEAATAGADREEGAQPEESRIRVWLLLSVAAGTICACAVTLIRKKKNLRTWGFIIGLAGALTALIFLIDIRTPESYYAGNAAEGSLRTVISIRCDSVAGRSEYAPESGVILLETEIRLPEGATAFDQLAETARRNRLQMEYDGTAAGVYVESIGFLYEYAFGNLSGWMYRINGVFADVGCSQYRLRDGDRIDWVYTTDLGKDVGDRTMGP